MSFFEKYFFYQLIKKIKQKCLGFLSLFFGFLFFLCLTGLVFLKIYTFNKKDGGNFPSFAQAVCHQAKVPRGAVKLLYWAELEQIHPSFAPSQWTNHPTHSEHNNQGCWALQIFWVQTPLTCSQSFKRALCLPRGSSAGTQELLLMSLLKVHTKIP